MHITNFFSCLLFLCVVQSAFCEQGFPSASILDQAKQVFGLEGNFTLIRKMENYIYSSKRGGEVVVLRLVEPTHRSESDLLAELDWTCFLNTHQAPVISPIPSKKGNLLEKLSDQQNTYYATLMTFAQGKPLPLEEVNAGIAYQWGKTVGLLHRLTKEYTPNPKRFEWEDHTLNYSLECPADPEDPYLWEMLHKIHLQITALPKGKDVYGMIHTDITPSNFHIDDKGKITVYDFDDSSYHWFVYDIATAIVLIDSEEHRNQFMKGYFSENSLTQEWIDLIPLFEMYRILQLHHWAILYRDEQTLDEVAFQEVEEWIVWTKNKLQACSSD